MIPFWDQIWYPNGISFGPRMGPKLAPLWDHNWSPNGIPDSPFLRSHSGPADGPGISRLDRNGKSQKSCPAKFRTGVPGAICDIEGLSCTEQRCANYLSALPNGLSKLRNGTRGPNFTVPRHGICEISYFEISSGSPSKHYVQ